MRLILLSLVSLLISQLASAQALRSECRFTLTDPEGGQSEAGVLRLKNTTHTITGELKYASDSQAQLLGDAHAKTWTRDEALKSRELVSMLKQLKVNTSELQQVRSFSFGLDSSVIYVELVDKNNSPSFRFVFMGGMLAARCK